MYRPYSIIFTLVVFVSAQTAARIYYDPAGNPRFYYPPSCNTSDVMLGECVPSIQCSRYNSVYPDINGLFIIRAQNGTCPFFLDVCCKSEDVIDNLIDKKPIPKGGWCGWRNPKGIGYETTGKQKAKFGEFPWTVAVFKKEPVVPNDPSTYINLYLGGGSLIHPSVALTAAHIVRGESLIVRAGEWDTQTDKEVYPHQDRNVKEVVLHKDFNISFFFYDIALLFLESPMTLAPNVGLVCLPPAGWRAAPGDRCFNSGWGKDTFGLNGKYQVIMKKVRVPVVDRNVCQNNLRSYRINPYFNLHPTFMCAGGERGIGTCAGDGGSPLVCPIDFKPGRYMQSGIMSLIVGCGEDSSPNVYVNVAELREWVDNEVVKKGLSTDFYTFE